MRRNQVGGGGCERRGGVRLGAGALRRLSAVAEALLLLSCVWLSLASSDDESGGGGTTTPTPPVETRTPCQTNAECPGFVSGNLCVARAECGVDKFCNQVVGVTCPAASNLCQTPTCEPTTGACFFAAAVDGSWCDDGQPCTNADACKAGSCFGAQVFCGDGGPCGSTKCNPSTGGCDVAYLPDGSKCDDGSKCTNNDACTQGSCVGLQASCDDGDTCTYDNCDASLGCVHQSQGVGQACDDGNQCTVQDICVAEGCRGVKSTVPCEDGNACTAGDSCTDGTCKPGAVVTGTCDDSNPCTIGTTCTSGLCGGGSAMVCTDDGDPCTSDACVAGQGCTYALTSGAPCVPGNPCAAGGQCTLEGCLPFGAVSNGTVCDDGNACSSKDNCQSGTCVAGEYLANTVCSDGNICTQGESCNAVGLCAGGVAVTCDDQNGCTADSCDPGLGCFNVPTLGEPCDDQDLCTLETYCGSDGKCAGGSPACPADGDPCTVDTCIGGGCSYDLAVGAEGCSTEVNCGNGVDDDDDGLVDCAEPGCFRASPACTLAPPPPWSYPPSGVSAGFGAVQGPSWDASWQLGGTQGELVFTGAGPGSAGISGPPPATQFGENRTLAQHCCVTTVSPTVLTWLEYVDWDVVELPIQRSVEVFTKGTLGPVAYQSHSLPLDLPAQGRWVRRQVDLPTGSTVGFAFQLHFVTEAPNADPGAGWLIDDVHVLTPESCSGGADTNGDGNIGCKDPTCRQAPECAESVCDNLADDNGDGFTDCDDQDCSAAPSCQ